LFAINLAKIFMTNKFQLEGNIQTKG